VSTLGGLLVLDRLAGLLWPASLALPAHWRFACQTSEFRFEVQTNAMGFRDREFSKNRSQQQRILVLGDSFTYGWGVAADEAWPKVLERALGSDVEVANLGTPGGSPLTYADIASRAIPTLRPDIVVAAVLQGDDAGQLELERSSDSRSRLRKAIAEIGRSALPTFWHQLRVSPLQSTSDLSAEDVRRNWMQDVTRVLAGLTPAQKQRYARVKHELQQSFESGDLNPFLLWCSMVRPNYYSAQASEDPAAASVRARSISPFLSKIHGIANRNGARVLVLSVPHGAFVNEGALDGVRSVGFEADSRMLASVAPDRVIAAAAGLASVPFVGVTEGFRRASHSPELFFHYDGHLTASGHRLLADLVKPHMIGLARKADSGATLPFEAVVQRRVERPLEGRRPGTDDGRR
jgi:hypothetical protein